MSKEVRQPPHYSNGNNASAEQWAAESARSQMWADVARQDAIRRYRSARRWAYVQVVIVSVVFGGMVGFLVWKFVL